MEAMDAMDAAMGAAAPTAAAPTAAADDAEGSVDPVTSLQHKLDDFAVMMYTYVGILQRDALPNGAQSEAQAGGDKDGAVAAPAERKKELSAQAAEFAKNIVSAAEEIDDQINRVGEIEDGVAGVRDAIVAADGESRQAKERLRVSSSNVRQRIAMVRDAFVEIETEDAGPL